jgi:hypothetical protein
MLVYAPFALCFVYTALHFYAFSGTNVLTRCHSASSQFSVVLCFRKVTQEIFSELYETKAKVPNYLARRRSPKESRRRTRGRPHLPAAPPDIALLPIYSLHQENPKGPNSFLENILQATAVVDVSLGGSRSSSWHPAGEGNHHRRPSSSPCLPQE